MEITPEDITCMIPARGGSRRIPGKNLVELGDRPLVAHAIETALSSRFFERVFVSTEDEKIADVARAYGATVPFLRPERFATDSSGIVDVILHFLDEREASGQRIEHLCILLPTSPLRNASDVNGTIETYDRESATYAMAVTDYFYPPWQALERNGARLQSFWDSEDIEQRTQELPDLCVDSGAVYVLNTHTFRENPTLYGENLVGYDIPPHRAIDIDEPFQLELARLIHSKMKQGELS